jgi:TonB family protein
MSVMRSCRASVCLMLLAGAASAAPPPVMPGAIAAAPDKRSNADLQYLDDRESKLHRAVWLLYGATAALGADVGGRSLAQDVNEWVADSAVSAQLRSLRRRAAQQAHAGNVRAARASLDAAEKLLDTAEQRLALVSDYWSLRLALVRQQELWQQWLLQAPSDMATASRQHIDELETVLRRDYVPSGNTGTVIADVRNLLQGYDSERGKLAGYVSERDNSTAGQLRATPCPEPGPPPQNNSGGPISADHPVGIRGSVDVSKYYPDETRRAWISGRIMLRLSIDATGCEQQAKVIRSSGAPELDAAAIQVVEHMRFYPAQRSGRFIGSQPALPVNFELHEPGTAASTPSVGTAANAAASAASPTLPQSDLQHMRRLLDAGQVVEARDAADALLAREPDNADALVARANAYRQLGRPDKAFEDSARVLQLRPDAPDGYFQSGLALLEQRKYDESIAQFSRAIELNPRDDWALANRGLDYALKQDVEHAHADLDAAYALNSGNYVVFHGRGVLAQQSQDLGTAITAYSAALQVNPQDVWALRRRAAAHWKLGEDALALVDANAVVQQRPKAADSYLTRAYYRGWQDFSDRTADLATALALEPRSTGALSMQAHLQIDKKDYVGAIRTLTDAINVGSDNMAMRTWRAIAYVRDSKSELGQQDIAAARAAAQTANAHNELCWVLALAAVALDDALQECDAALTTGQESAYLDSRGLVLYRLRRFEEAIASYDAALAKRPGQANSLYGRGLAKRARGDSQAGDADIQAAISADHHIVDDIPADASPP